MRPDKDRGGGRHTPCYSLFPVLDGNLRLVRRALMDDAIKPLSEANSAQGGNDRPDVNCYRVWPSQPPGQPGRITTMRTTISATAWHYCQRLRLAPCLLTSRLEGATPGRVYYLLATHAPPEGRPKVALPCSTGAKRGQPNQMQAAALARRARKRDATLRSRRDARAQPTPDDDAATICFATAAATTGSLE